MVEVVDWLFEGGVDEGWIMVCDRCGGMGEDEGKMLKREIVGKGEGSGESVRG